MSLIVVHGDHSIEFAALEAVEERIGRVGAACLEPLGLRGLDCWRDLIDLFATEQAASRREGSTRRQRSASARSQIAQRLIANRMTARIRPLLTFSQALRSDVWAETWMTRIRPTTSIIP
jgi:hypothetical protein